MKNKIDNKYANKIVNAFLKNKIISPLPVKYTRKISQAQKFRKLCESKIKKPIIGFNLGFRQCIVFCVCPFDRKVGSNNSSELEIVGES